MVRGRLGALKICSEKMFYAVRNGRQCGIYKSWDECKEQVNGYSGARFKKFKSRNEALDFMEQGKSSYGSAKRYKPAPRWSESQSYSNISEDTGQMSSQQSSSAPVVYTDGGCFANGRRKAQAGIGVFWGDGDTRNVSERLQGYQTNQRAELNAAIKAVEQAESNGMNELELRTDSMYTINCATSWIPTWKRNGWKAATGADVKNKADIQKLDDLCQKVKVNWVHVRGHQGTYGNEQADRLSKKGAMKDQK